MDIKIYNTLSKTKEIFKPLETNKVSMYHCGPTVYDRIHIGNLRAAIFDDFLRRMFEFNGYKVHQVMNITDVGHLTSDSDSGEDKMSKALKREGMPMTLEAMHDIATKYFKEYLSDLNKLNIELPNKFPRASDHIAENIELIKKLESNGFTYKISDGLYFDTSKFPSYGKLGNIDIENLKEGARVNINSEKKNPTDFALWKANSGIGWDSPWGKGFPGWHIECSAMSAKYLGQPFDIHTGAIDLIPIHHNNEIAQSEAAYGVPLANYWMHNEFLILDSGKMSKSVGNVINIDTLIEESISPLAYRYWLLTAHYRSPVKFSYEAVQASQNALIKLISKVREYPEGGSIIPKYKENFNELINDDLNTPQALALTWDMINDDKSSDADKRATLIAFDKVFGLKLDIIKSEPVTEIPIEIKALADARELARKKKDWKQADALRTEIESRGFTIKDTPEGIKISEK